MFEKFFEKYPDYITIEQPSESVLNAFKSKLPDQLIGFWNTYGFGIGMNGYLKIINPAEFQTDFDAAYNNKDKEIVFAVTALGDFLTWTGDAIRAVYFKNEYDEIIESGDDMEWFFDMDLADEGFLRDNLNDEQYLAAKDKLGEPGYDECYGYVPLLGSGGAEKAENLRKVKIKEYIAMIAQMLGRIE